MKIIIIVMIAMVTLISCESSKEVSAERLSIIKKLVESGRFTIIQHEAQPLVTNELSQLTAAGLLGPGNTSNTIFLQDQSNYITVNEGDVEGSLAFYGEIQMAMSPGQNNGIEFENQNATDYKVVFNEKKKLHTITFTAKNKTENFNIIIEVFGNGNASTIISSSHRNSIRYRGRIKALPNKKES